MVKIKWLVNIQDNTCREPYAHSEVVQKERDTIMVEFRGECRTFSPQQMQGIFPDFFNISHALIMADVLDRGIDFRQVSL